MKAGIIILITALIAAPISRGSSPVSWYEPDTIDIVKSGMLDKYPDLKARYIKASIENYWQDREFKRNLTKLRQIRAGEWPREAGEQAKGLFEKFVQEPPLFASESGRVIDTNVNQFIKIIDSISKFRPVSVSWFERLPVGANVQ